jgi:hypothetical protein
VDDSGVTGAWLGPNEFMLMLQILIGDIELVASSSKRINTLLFAPRLMLERGHQFTRRRSRIAQRRPIPASRKALSA